VASSGTRRPPKRERSRETVRAIVQAGERILLQEGIEHFTIKRIAEVAGVGKATLYEYFASADEVRRAVEEHSWPRAIAEITAAMQLPPLATPDEGLERFVKAALDALARRIAMHGMTLTVRDEARAAMLSGLAAHGLDVLRSRAPSERMRFPDDDMELAAAVIVRLVPLLAWLGEQDFRAELESGAFQRVAARMVRCLLLRDAEAVATPPSRAAP